MLSRFKVCEDGGGDEMLILSARWSLLYRITSCGTPWQRNLQLVCVFQAEEYCGKAKMISHAIPLIRPPPLEGFPRRWRTLSGADWERNRLSWYKFNHADQDMRRCKHVCWGSTSKKTWAEEPCRFAEARKTPYKQSRGKKQDRRGADVWLYSKPSFRFFFVGRCWRWRRVAHFQFAFGSEGVSLGRECSCSSFRLLFTDDVGRIWSCGHRHFSWRWKWTECAPLEASAQVSLEPLTWLWH